MPTKALGSDYFGINNYPIHICKVERMQNITHVADLTEIEHYHDFTEIVLIIRGQGMQVIDNNEYMVSAGDAFVLQGNQHHYFKDAGNLEIVNIMYDSHRVNISQNVKQMEGYKALFFLEPQYRTQHHFKNRLHIERADMAKIEYVVNTMILEQNSKHEGYEIIIANRLEELIVLLSRHYSQLETTEAQALMRIGKVISYLEYNHNSKIYLEQLAEMSNMSVRNFQRIFKKAVGSSPSIYLIQIRIQTARRLLRETNMAIADIATEIGFTDTNYFIKCFKKETGSTPLKFRMRNVS
ncbi:MAG: helix-turn-helix domain-containing protein [Salinivirgaceae bacterium]|nr:helix-turn-helix domain-containing protein [Salinivirgaceae bacterium]